MLIDKFDRVHDYLRISLTDNCNLRCFYCMPEEDYEFTPASRLMQPDEIETLAKIFVAQGVKKIRLTGGEPLIRKDAANIILRLAKLPVKLSMTTNGTRLHEFVPVLETANITTLNISLDTLVSDKFMLITRRDQFTSSPTSTSIAPRSRCAATRAACRRAPAHRLRFRAATLATIAPSCPSRTCAGTMPLHTARGWAAGFRPRPSGSTRHAAAPGARSRGEISTTLTSPITAHGPTTRPTGATASWA